MVIWPAFRMGQYRVNDHPYHAPQFIGVNFWRAMASCEYRFQKIMRTRRNGSAAHVFNLENNDSRSIIRQIIQLDSLEKFIRFYLFIFTLKIKNIYYYVTFAGYVTRWPNWGMVTKWRTKLRNDSNGSSSLVVQESSAGSSGRLLNEFTIRIVTEYNCPLNQNHDSFPVKDYPFKITWFAHVCHQGYEFLRN